MSRVPSTADLREALDAELSRVASLRWRLQGLGEGSAVAGELLLDILDDTDQPRIAALVPPGGKGLDQGQARLEQ